MSLADPEPGIHANGELTAGAGAAQPGDELVGEPHDPAGGVGAALAQPGVEDLAGVGTEGEQRVQPQPTGVAVASALLVVPVDLADRGVHVHDQRPVTRSGAGPPRAAEKLTGHLVELADMAERERTQPGPDRRGCHHAVPQHRLG
jgi:hypothetical protein